MNTGLDIFKNAQRLAGGTGDLGYDPSYPGPTNPRGSGSGVPTQRFVGGLFGALGTPWGLSWLTGPGASWVTRMIQNGASQAQVQRAVQGYMASGGQSGDNVTAPPVDDGSNVTAPVTNAPPSAGIGIDPFGNPADPGEFWSNDFGRWGEGDQYGTTPGNYNPPGPGGGYGTRGVWGGQTTIPIASDPNFTPSLGWAMPAASGGGAYGGNTMAKIAMHGTFRNNATPEQWNFMQNYLQGGGGGGGSGQGVGGAGRPMTQSQQKGSADIGYKIFKKFQSGSEAVPSELPSPPEEELTMKRNSLGNLRPAMLTKALGEELGGLSKEDVAKMVVAGLLTGGEGGKVPRGEEPLIFGHTFEQIKSAQQRGRLSDPLKGPATKPSATDADRALLEKHGLEGLQEKGLFGVLDRLGLPMSKEPPQAQQMGTSSVNPGLKLFHAQQLKRKKP